MHTWVTRRCSTQHWHRTPMNIEPSDPAQSVGGTAAQGHFRDGERTAKPQMRRTEAKKDTGFNRMLHLPCSAIGGYRNDEREMLP